MPGTNRPVGPGIVSVPFIPSLLVRFRAVVPYRPWPNSWGVSGRESSECCCNHYNNHGRRARSSKSRVPRSLLAAKKELNYLLSKAVCFPPAQRRRRRLRWSCERGRREWSSRWVCEERIILFVIVHPRRPSSQTHDGSKAHSPHFQHPSFA